MNFDFFKEHKRQSAVREHLLGFGEDFTERQKKAIICSLLLIANSDGEYHRKEKQFLELSASLLGYQLQDDFFDEFESFDPVDIPNLLNSLDEGQKDWFILTVAGMVHADGRALEIEFQLMEGILKKMGITEQRFMDVLKKTQLMMEYFK